MTHPRGRLPARVYWFRRTLVTLLALLLVFVIARVLGSFGGDDASGQATTVARTQPQAPAHVSGVVLSPTGGATASGPLSQPTGTCKDADVKVVPGVDTLYGGGAQPLTMLVSTTNGETCRWKVSSDALAVKITGAGQRIWSSQDCPGVVPTTSVVVRPPEEPNSKVQVAWGGHRSVPDCVGGQSYVGLGSYRMIASSLGGEPAQASFTIVAPPRVRVTETAKPSASPSKSASASASPSAKATRKPGASASAKPTGKATGTATARPSKTPSRSPGRTASPKA